MEIDLKVFQLRRLGIPQERIALCLGVLQQTIAKHLQKMATSPNVVNTDLKRGFIVTKSLKSMPAPPAPLNRVPFGCPTGVGPEDRTGGWTEPLAWSIALEGQEELERFKALNWGLQTWDLGSWNDCLPR